MSEIDFKHRVIFKKSALKRSGNRAKKKVYKAAGEAKIENADRNRSLTDLQVLFARSLQRTHSIRVLSEQFGCSQTALRRAVKGETFKHLNAERKPWK
jgi:AraC-like DNA-binding protein